ncbi:MAG TPA: sigma-70 family RNA polymerase sigma factor [Polyangiaceae bacterium]|nr:sigma-70 family RNA polymerase sigma factor [Polyangiaceae bacterium]
MTRVRAELTAAPGAQLPLSAPDFAAFEAVYRGHFRFVWRSLRRLGVPERDLADAVQEVFVVVHKKFAEFDAGTRVTTWLYAIALRVASDRRRRASERHEVLGEVPEPTSVAATDSSELAERRALLEKALSALPLEQRAVFTLFELEGLDGAEIATLLAIPVATVHSRLRLAREGFRRVVTRARVREAFELVRLGEEKP